MDTIHDQMDGAESAFFLRELEHVKAQTYDIVYPELMARQLIPVSNEVNAGAETVTYQQFDRHGRAKVVGSKAKDIPRIDVNGLEFTRPVRTVAGAYAWDVQEIKAAAMAGRDLNPRRAAATRRSVEETMDEIAAVGDPDNGIVSGFLNDAAVAIDAATGNWDSQTALVILGDITDMMAAMDTDTEAIEKPNTLILPPEQYTIVQNLERSTGSDFTVLKWIEGNYGLTVRKWYRATGAGAAAVDRGVLYNNSPEKLQQDIPSEFEQLPVQAQGLELIVNTMARTAGTEMYYPRSIRYIDGI